MLTRGGSVRVSGGTESGASYGRITNLPAQKLLGDGRPLHVAGALVDSADLGVPIQFFDRIIAGKADAAEYFYCARGHPLGHFGGEELAHRSFGDERRTGVPQARCVIDQQASRLNFSGHFGELELHALELRDVLAELLAFPGVSEGVVERALSEPCHLRADAYAAFVQRLD